MMQHQCSDLDAWPGEAVAASQHAQPGRCDLATAACATAARRPLKMMLRLVVLVAATAALQLPQSALQAHPTRPAALPQSAQAQRASRQARRAALSAATLFANAPALALGTGDGALDGAGVGITGVAWVDTLYFFFFCGICGLLYTTTLDFGEEPARRPPPPSPPADDAADDGPPL